MSHHRKKHWTSKGRNNRLKHKKIRNALKNASITALSLAKAFHSRYGDGLNQKSYREKDEI